MSKRNDGCFTTMYMQTYHTSWPAYEAPVTVYPTPPMKCSYCGMLGDDYRCASCGAPVAPVQHARPVFPANRRVR